MLRMFISFVLIAVISASDNGRYQGPLTTGKSRVHTIRWFYNDSSATCQPFVYRGCHNNGNNFVTQRICDETCVNSIDVRCETFTCTLLCENGFKTAESGCLLCECAQPPGCPATQCMLHCEYGFKRDDRGCDRCECYGVLHCPDVSCNTPCPYGFVWKHGCQTCECNRHMCETIHCEVDEVCLAPPDDCSSPLCASYARCVPAKDLDQQFGREGFSFIMFIKHSKKDMDVDTALLKWYVHRRLTYWLQLQPNCIEHLQVRSVKPAKVRIRFELAKDKGCRPINVALRLRAFTHTYGNMKFRGVIFGIDPRSLQAVTYFDGWLPRQICFAVSCLVFAISFVLLIPMLIISYMRRRAGTKRRDKSPMMSHVSFPETLSL